MAHRDIVPGGGHLEPALEAADHCPIVVVIFSSNTSVAYIYVLERAAARGVPIIFVMCDRVEPPAEFKRFKQSCLAIDAFTHPLEWSSRSLVGMVKSLRDPHPAGSEMVNRFVDRSLLQDAQLTSRHKSALAKGQRVASTGGSPSPRGRSDDAHFSVRAISPRLGVEDSKVGLGLALAGLAMAAGAIEIFFPAEINGLQDTLKGLLAIWAQAGLVPLRAN